ncbi:MAG: hypothetical protein LH660_08050 [Phormidesmis sp. CAN_BIN36]|nr:hypothetical protein [Phormidesmis sp. CAN_BIN36]
MKTNTVTKALAASAVALSLAVLPAFAQTGGTGTTTTRTDYNNDEGRGGYWGLMGLLGLFGLLGRRSKEDDVATAYRDPSTSETMGTRRP